MGVKNKRIKSLKHDKGTDDLSYYTSKKRINCPGSFKSKILFDSKKEADLFLQYAKEKEFHRGYKPVRSYFCKHCNGWHVTSSSEKQNISSYINPFFLIRDWTKGWELIEYYKNDHLLEIDIIKEESKERIVIFEDELMERLLDHNPNISEAYIDKYSNKRFVIKFKE